jgi:hypothetical protein
MSLNNVERVFWEFGDQPARIEQFKADPDAYLAAYSLDEAECEAIKDVDLKTLADRGVNTLLTLMIWPLLKGPEGMPFAYLEHMNGGKMPSPPGA